MWFDGSESYFRDMLSHTKGMSSFTKHFLKLAAILSLTLTITTMLAQRTLSKQRHLPQKLSLTFDQLTAGNLKTPPPPFLFTQIKSILTAAKVTPRDSSFSRCLWYEVTSNFSSVEIENIRMRLPILAFVKRICKHIDIYSTSRGSWARSQLLS